MAGLVEPRDVLTTYRYLRIAMPVLVVVLAAAVVYQIVAPAAGACWLGSISACYYTSARAVFVACLCAIGTCLVVYRGSTTREDVILNVPGFMAFVVAFVPTPLEEVTGPVGAPACAPGNVPTTAQLDAAVDNNIAALLVGATAVVGVIAWFRRHARQPDSPALPGAGALVVTGSLVVVGWIVFLVRPELVRDHGHLVAAFVVFAGIVVVVALNSFTFPWLDRDAVAAQLRYQRAYRVILAAMLLVLAVLGPLALAEVFDHAVFWLEAGVIALFAGYWVLQTMELWQVTNRAQLR